MDGAAVENGPHRTIRVSLFALRLIATKLSKFARALDKAAFAVRALHRSRLGRRGDLSHEMLVQQLCVGLWCHLTHVTRATE